MAKIALVGEAPGKEEEAIGLPFVGAAGRELNKLLAEANIVRRECVITNTFNERPGTFYSRLTGAPRPETANDLKWATVPPTTPGAIGYSGLYFHPDYALPNLERLERELLQSKPTLIVALGNTALWALTRNIGVSKFRGTVLWSDKYNCKVIPTYHPAAVLREWSYRPVVLADLIKAKAESEFPEIREPKFEILIPETLEDFDEVRPKLLETDLLSIDIETSRGQLTCIGFAPTDELAVVVPFWDLRKESRSFYSYEMEVAALRFVKEILLSPTPKLGQNFMYDLNYLFELGFPVRAFVHDTMLMHHSLYPEMEKSLAFLGSIYTRKPAWKQLRPKGRRTEKKDE